MMFYMTTLNGIVKKPKSLFGGGKGWNLWNLTLFNNTVKEYGHS